MRTLLFTSLFLYSSLLWAIDGISVSAETEYLDLSGQTYLFSDTTDELSVEKITNLPFSIWSKRSLTGYSKTTEWILIPFVNETSEPFDRVLYLSNSISHKIDFYFVLNGELQNRHVTSGLARSRKSKLYNDPGYPISVHFPSKSKLWVLVKVQDALSSMQTPFHLLSEKKAFELKDKNLSFLFFWLGILMLSIVLAGLLFVNTKQKMFLYYILFALATGVIISSNTGVVTMFIDSDPFQIVTNYYQWGAVILLVFMPRFIDSIVSIRPVSKRGWNLMMSIGYTAIGIATLYSIPFFKFSFFFTRLFINIIVGFSGILFLYVLVTLLIASLRRQPRALPLFFVYLFYLSLGFSNVILPLFGMADESLNGIHLVMAGSILETLAFMGFMGHATLAVYKEREQLYQQVQDNQQVMMEAIVKGQEDERNRFARDLHDGFGQMISALNLNLKGLKTLKSSNTEDRTKIFSTSSELLDQMHRELKNICFDLMPQTLIKHGLEAAINEFSSRINSSGEMTVEVNVFELDSLSELQEISIYRIAQEWVNNVLKYSDAKHLTIQITRDEKELTLLIEDNGMGFDRNLLTSGKGNGWKNMNSRANLISGEIEFDTTLGMKGNTFILNARLDVVKNQNTELLDTEIRNIN